MCLETDISAQVPPIGMKFRMMVHMCPGCVLLLLGYPKGAPKSQILTANISKTVSRSVTPQMGRNIGSTKTFQKYIAWDGSPPMESLIMKDMHFFARGQICCADRRKNLHLLCPVRGFLHFSWRYL